MLSTLESPNTVIIGETTYANDVHALSDYTLPARHEFNMAFQYELASIDSGGAAHNHCFEPRAWTLPELKAIIARQQLCGNRESLWNRCVGAGNRPRKHDLTTAG